MMVLYIARLHYIERLFRKTKWVFQILFISREEFRFSRMIWFCARIVSAEHMKGDIVQLVILNTYIYNVYQVMISDPMCLYQFVLCVFN